MAQPTVWAVCLTADRPEMTRLAIACFRAQTYRNKWLVVYDSGATPLPAQQWQPNELYIRGTPASVGKLRNQALIEASLYVLALTRKSASKSDIVMHWDSDDWSAPSRMEDQVQGLQSCGAEVIGYNQMIFWDCRISEAWLYTAADPNYMLGTSLCYWLSTWQRKPFPDRTKGEDLAWQTGLKRASGIAGEVMLALRHGGNTGSEIRPGDLEWQRVPYLDAFCAERFGQSVKVRA